MGGGAGSEECLWNEIGETGEPRENTQKISILPTTIDPLVTPRLELETPVGTGEWSRLVNIIYVRFLFIRRTHAIV